MGFGELKGFKDKFHYYDPASRIKVKTDESVFHGHTVFVKKDGEVIASGVMTVMGAVDILVDDGGKLLVECYSEEQYSDEATYAVNDVCVFEGKFKKCTVAVSTPEEFDPAKWTDTTGFHSGVKLNVQAYGVYNAKLASRHNYTFEIISANGDPGSRVVYTGENVDFTPAKMNYVSGEFEWGSWEDAFFMPKPCMLKYDGTVAYYLDPNDYSKKEDGTASEISSTSFGGNAMMEWPKIWLMQNNDATKEYFGIANYEVDGNYNCYANHDKNGNEIDHFYTPIFNGSLVSGTMRSLSGQVPMNTHPGADEISAALNNGQNMWYIERFVDRNLINILLFLIGRSTDTQTTFGRGYDTGGSSAAHLKQSGSMNDKGLFWGDQSGSNGVKVFGMEHWWGNIWRRTAGLLANGQRIYSKLTWGTEDGTSVDGYQTTSITGYTDSGISVGGTSGGYINSTLNSPMGRFPKTASGSSSTFDCDGVYFTNSGTNYARFGGSCDNGLVCGASACHLNGALSSSNWNNGAALSCKPLAS